MRDEIKNNIKIIALIVVVFIILYFLHLTIGDWFENQYDDHFEMGETSIIFSMDSLNKTLTVEEIYSNEITLHWPEVVIYSGSAKIPFGTIDIGDEITDCDGHLELRWKDTDILIFSTDFS